MRFRSLILSASVRLAVPVVLFSFALAARADTTYTYTGKDFTSAFSPFTTSDSVTGSFTVSSPLGDNLDDSSINPASFSFSDGVDTIDNSNVLSINDFDVSTNSSGQIVDWGISLTISGAAIETVGGPLNSADEGDLVSYQGDVALNSVAGLFSDGVTTSVTPEPASIVLLGTGLLGVCGVVRRRLV